MTITNSKIHTEKVAMPKSAYPTNIYRDFDASLASIDDVDGDISNMSRDTNIADEVDSDGSEDSSFDEMLGRRRYSVPSSPVTPTRRASLQSSNAPRGHLFQLKHSQAPVYLSYPANADLESAHIDNYGRVEYEFATKERAMVVIIPNSRGLSINNQKLADAYSTRTGCVTALLDVYFNDPLPDTSGSPQPSQDALDQSANGSSIGGGFMARFRSLTLDLASSVKRTYWLQSHTIFGVFEESEKRFHTTTEWTTVKQSIDELLQTYLVQSAVVIGFSFGSNAAARVAIEGMLNREGEDTKGTSKPKEATMDKDGKPASVIKGVVLVHPIYMPLEVCSVVKVPTYLIVGHEDSFYSKEDLGKLEKDLKIRKDRYNFKYLQLTTTPDTPHGFAIAGDYPPMKLGELPSKTCQKITKWILERI